MTKRQLSVPEKHQLRIARDTLKMNDVMVGVMGGPTKAQARQIIYELTGKRPRENPSKSKFYIVQAVPPGLRSSYPLSEVKPGTRVKLLEYAPKGSLDVVDVRLPNGTIASVYSFQLESNFGGMPNPGAAWHERMRGEALDVVEALGPIRGNWSAGRANAHEYSASTSRKMGMPNPQRKQFKLFGLPILPIALVGGLIWWLNKNNKT